MSELTKKQEIKLKFLFDVFDADKSGTLDIEELRNIAHQYGQYPSNKKLEKAVKLIDLNQNGRIDFEELKIVFAAVIKSPEKSQSELVKAIGTLMTKKGMNIDDILTPDLFFDILEGKGKYPMTKENCETIFGAIGKNEATKEEIARVLRS